VEPKPIVTEDTVKSFLDAFNRHDLVDIMSFFGNHPVFAKFALPDTRQGHC
jgi:hypothetical protein